MKKRSRRLSEKGINTKRWGPEEGEGSGFEIILNKKIARGRCQINWGKRGHGFAEKTGLRRENGPPYRPRSAKRFI